MLMKDLLARLNKVKRTGDDQYSACCPAHDDKHASLSVKKNAEGKILVYCHAGCTTENVLSAMGLTMADLFADDGKTADSTKALDCEQKRTVVAKYPYCTADGTVVAEKLRYDPKGFAWRVPKDNGQWDYHKPPFAPPYNTPALLKASKVVLVEGEKDADTITSFGITAVSLPDGAMSGKWPEQYTGFFVGKEVVIIPDNDSVGKQYGEAAAAALKAVAKSVVVVDLKTIWPAIPDKGDVSDFVQAEGDKAITQLKMLIAGTQKKPSMKMTKKQLESKIAKLNPAFNHKYTWNDNGSGRLFADLFKDRARYVPERKMWFVFDGMRWVPDSADMKVMEMCKYAGDALAVYALGIKDEDKKKAYFKYVNRWLERRTRVVILRDAESVYPITMIEFDADDSLFNCLNGTIDLRTMEFHPHDPEDKITKLANVNYDPAAKCLRFEQFLDEVMSNDADKSAFLMKALGYSLGGDSSYECMFFLYGATTRNGKSTLMETVLRLLGDYGRTVRPETIAAKHKADSNTPSEDLARLAGIRLANIAEPSRGLRLNAAQVKNMTGNDTINARFLHENSFDFRPQFKMYINTNYLPTIEDMTLFSSNRVYIIPFDRHFEECEQDHNLKNLFAEEEAKSAVLNWLLEGFELLQKEGLNPPAAVVESTKQYRHDSDKMQLFADDCLDIGVAYEERTSVIYEAYKSWCEKNGFLAESTRNFKKMLVSLGKIERKRPADGGEKTTMLIGCRLKPWEERQ